MVKQTVPMDSSRFVEFWQHEVPDGSSCSLAEPFEEALNLTLRLLVVVSLRPLGAGEEPGPLVNHAFVLRSDRPLVAPSSKTARAVAAPDGDLVIGVLLASREGTALAIGHETRVGKMNRGGTGAMHPAERPPTGLTVGRVTEAAMDRTVSDLHAFDPSSQEARCHLCIVGQVCGLRPPRYQRCGSSAGNGFEVGMRRRGEGLG